MTTDGAQRGHVKWFDAAKGLGLISPDVSGGLDVYVQAKSIVSPGVQRLDVGQAVSYDAPPAHGSSRSFATNVRVL